MTNSASSLLRRLMVGSSLVIVGMALLGLSNAILDAKANQAARTASENKARARELFLHMVLTAPERAKIVALAETSESLRRQMFNELDYHSRVRLRIWMHSALVYNSAPGLADALPGPDDARPRGVNGWVRWVERDAASGIQVERMHEVDDEWMLTLAGLRFLLTPTLASLPLLLLLAFLVIRVGLAPLRAIAATIEGRAGSDLSALPASPYRELSPLIDAINRLVARLRQKIEREHEFLSDAAHELKTPLAAIQIHAHLLTSRLERAAAIGADDEAGRGLRDGIGRATHVVHQLLALERVAAESAHDAPVLVSLEALVRDRLAHAAPLAFSRAIDIELLTDTPHPLVLHGESMAALLDNLIGNAIKYSPEGGTVMVSLAAEGAESVLRIRDHGPGIPPELRSKVFERFFRIAGADQPGSGLGLAIAERAARRNGAAISLEAVPDGGPGLVAVVRFGVAGARRIA